MRAAASLERSTGRKTALCAAACAMALSYALPAGAAEVRFKAPAECGDVSDVVKEVEELIGRPIGSVDAVDFEIEISKRGDGSWELELRSLERSSNLPRTRKFSGNTCAEVTNAATVAISMAVQAEEPNAVASEPPSREGEVPPISTTTERPLAPEIPQPTPSREMRAPAVRQKPVSIRPSAGLSLVGDIGALPKPGPGAEVSASLGYQSVRFTLLGAAFSSQSTRLSSGTGGEFQLAFGGALFCYESAGPGLGILGCAGAELGKLHGQGTGVSDPRERSAWWQAARAECGVNVPLGQSLYLALRAGAVLPLSRPEFVVDGTESVHRPAVVTGRASVGVEIRM